MTSLNWIFCEICVARLASKRVVSSFPANFSEPVFLAAVSLGSGKEKKELFLLDVKKGREIDLKKTRRCDVNSLLESCNMIINKMNLNCNHISVLHSLFIENNRTDEMETRVAKFLVFLPKYALIKPG